MQGNYSWKCVDCDENHLLPLPKANTKHFCAVCGSTLNREVANAEQTTPPSIFQLPTVHGINASWDGLFDILGDEFREAVQDSIAMTAPSRQISTKYLSTLGKVVVDSRQSILHDVSVIIGPLSILAVSASFGYLPDQPFECVFQLVLGSTVLEPTAVPQGSIVALRRGVTSFESKGHQAVAAGAAALLVLQTYDKWPFLMTSDESSAPLSIPVIMVSKLHGELITKMATVFSSKGKPPVDVKVKIGERITECSVYQDNFVEGQEVYKLPCRHVYHCDCVATWLQNNHTCPLCRLQLPKELPAIADTSSSRNEINDVYY